MSTRLEELVERLGGQLMGDPNIEVLGIAPLDSADASHITFLSNPKLRALVAQTRAAAVILTAADSATIGTAYKGARIIAANPYAYFARAAQLFADRHAIPPQPGIHPSAVVDPSALIADSACIGPFVTIEADAVVEERCVIGSGSFIGRSAKIGTGTQFFARVSFHAGCEIGQSGIVHSGAVIGADGFGFANEDGAWIKIPQTGRVKIQIAHNCHIGAHTARAGCVGVAGSAKIGKYCTFGGAAMVLGHLTIVDHVHVSSGSMVSRSIPEPGKYTGFYPLAKNADWEKSAVIVRNLASMREKVRELEKMVKLLSEKE
jgi:UDP-3-O-[3-hydroxymyristoyl] glucosamine N-acyltransferase